MYLQLIRVDFDFVVVGSGDDDDDVIFINFEYARHIDLCFGREFQVCKSDYPL